MYVYEWISIVFLLRFLKESDNERSKEVEEFQSEKMTLVKEHIELQQQLQHLRYDKLILQCSGPSIVCEILWIL